MCSELAFAASVELVQLVIRGECLSGDDGIADDRSLILVPQKAELNCCTAIHYLTVFLSLAVLKSSTVIQCHSSLETTGNI